MQGYSLKNSTFLLTKHFICNKFIAIICNTKGQSHRKAATQNHGSTAERPRQPGCRRLFNTMPLGADALRLFFFENHNFFSSNNRIVPMNG